jgi:hypothetical protein
MTVVEPCVIVTVIDWVAGEIYAGRFAPSDPGVGVGLGTVTTKVALFFAATPKGIGLVPGRAGLLPLFPLHVASSAPLTAMRRRREPAFQFIRAPYKAAVAIAFHTWAARLMADARRVDAN